MSYRPPRDAPKWKRDFPLQSAGEDEVTRREFVRYMTLASAAFAAGNVAIAAWSSLRRVDHGRPKRLVALDAVRPGTSYLFRFPTRHDPAILIRYPDGPDGPRLHAVSQKCTHLSCVVYYDPGKDRLECPCHEGVFDARTGAVEYGPPQRPLPRIDVEVRRGVIWATRVEV
ncbi:MAG: Rieske 2Fe-2S domain-containing protein [Acidimicrobiia bacterium]|nr:Rieske 2Fe-2S domain-containing protein [Acidimicrobiia bacterium]